MRRSKRLWIITPIVAAVALAVTLAVLLIPGRVGAEPPTRTTVDQTLTVSLPTAFTGCGFPITLNQVGSGHGHDVL
jgi:hypothetical protein